MKRPHVKDNNAGEAKSSKKSSEKDESYLFFSLIAKVLKNTILAKENTKLT